MCMSITQKILDMLAMQGEPHAFSNKYGISIKKEWTGKGYGKFHDQFDPFYCANSEQLICFK